MLYPQEYPHFIGRGIIYIPLHVVSVLLNDVVRSPFFYQVCSDINKPNGQFILPNERIAVMTFISSLPIRKVCPASLLPSDFVYLNKNSPFLFKKYCVNILLLIFFFLNFFLSSHLL